DQHNVARGRAEMDLAGVERDTLIALGLQRVEQERPFKGHSPARAHGFERFKLARRETVSFVQQASDQRRFAVIDMADNDDADEGASGGGGSGYGGEVRGDIHGTTLRSEITGGT